MGAYSKIVTIILLLVVLAIGLLVVRDVGDGSKEVINQQDNVQCIAQGGICTPECNDEIQGLELCAEGLKCCRR